MTISSNQIRNGFIDFFTEKKHLFVPSSPVIPQDDPTLLFTNAGMNQFKDIFLGTASRDYTRAANSQKCIRAGGKHNDLEDVGKDTYHHTFFEMLGNWSLGDYFKAEAIEWAWELLTKVWGLDKSQLYVTVFEGDKNDGLEPDTQAYELWPKITDIDKNRLLMFGKKDNFWEMGETGPCGPCSEIHIDLGPEMCDMKGVQGHKCSVNAGCSRFIELWNLVFIQYNRTAQGDVVPLPARHVDTGMGLERITAVLQNKRSNYDTDLFKPIIDSIADLSHKKYTGELTDNKDIAFRVIADHIRTLTFAITDGGVPSNEGRGYVLRRILRRASRFGRVLNMHEPFMYKLVGKVVELMHDAFEEIGPRREFVETVIKSEETSFGRTLDRGLSIFETAAETAENKANQTISGNDAFQLYDTYGFPLDLTQLMARERGLGVDSDEFEKLMDEQRQRARAAQKNSSAGFVTDVQLPKTDDSAKYETDICKAKIIGWITNDSFITEGHIDESTGKVGLVLDRTCFYAEAGGQVGDCGIIKHDDVEFIVSYTSKIGDCVVHNGKIITGKFSIGEEVTATVSKDRDSIKKNHTATHLLQWALQSVLDNSVAQQGSLVSPDYLRFDFTCPNALTPEQINQVQRLITEKIQSGLDVNSVTMPIDQAKKLGAMALFGEKYGDQVRIVAIGSENKGGLSEAFSKEFCGGTHVDNIGSIGGLRILKEESISAGVRRITAITGAKLMKFYEERSEIVDELSRILKVPAQEVIQRITKLLDDNKKLNKQIKNASRQTGTDVMGQARKLADNCEKIKDSAVIASQLDQVTAEQARAAIDMLKNKCGSAAIVFGFAEEDKVTLLAGVTDDLVKKGIKAGDIVKQIAPIVGGGGGGRPQMAQAGGKDPSKIGEALDKAIEIIKTKLTE